MKAINYVMIGVICLVGAFAGSTLSDMRKKKKCSCAGHDKGAAAPSAPEQAATPVGSQAAANESVAFSADGWGLRAAV